MITKKYICAVIFMTVVLLIFYFNRKDEEFINGNEVDRYSTCPTGVPCAYSKQVDFRIIVITFNRPESLMKLLRTLDTVELDGDIGCLEIWIDRDRKGRVHKKTFDVALAFQWKKGLTRVHVQSEHAGIYGQWINTWRPPAEEDGKSKELALILEDDISVSRYIYRWIKSVHRFYGSRDDFAGSSLTSDELKSHDGSFATLRAPRNDPAFMYKCIGTWGFTPKPSVWRDFQDWFHQYSYEPGFVPDVPGIKPTEWFHELNASGKGDSMWEQWFIYFAYKQKLFTIYNNLAEFNSNKLSCLCINRREVGLHVSQKGPEDYCQLLDRWDDKFVTFNPNILKLNWNGQPTDSY